MDNKTTNHAEDLDAPIEGLADDNKGNSTDGDDEDNDEALEIDYSKGEPEESAVDRLKAPLKSFKANGPKVTVAPQTILKITRASDLGEWGVSGVFYGPPGVGKTTLCAEGPQDSPHGAPVLVLDAEGGARAISHRDDIDVAQIKNTRDLDKVRDWAMTGVFPYKTIVLDNVSEIAMASLYAIVGNRAPEIQHYGENTRRVLSIVRDFREVAQSQAINVFFILWDKPEKDSSTNLVKRELSLTPALAQVLPGIVDMIGYLSLAPDNKTRVLSFAASNKNVAKFRRNRTEAAQSIPLTISYTLEDNLMVDLLATLRGKEPFPVAKYQRHQKTPANQPTQQPQPSNLKAKK